MSGGVQRWQEAVVTGLSGSALAAGTGALVGLALPAAVVGAAHGALAGHRRVYEWRRPSGVAAFVLDHTWALVTSAASLVSHAVAAVNPRSVWIAEASERRGRHTYIGGFQIRPGFVITIGNTISGVAADAWPRRRYLVEVHEHAHVWQSRLAGPLFPVVYVGWIVVGGAAGLAAGFTFGGKGPVRERLRTAIRQADTWGYWCNPFEWWAYSREGRWPPSDRRWVWPRSFVRPATDSPGSRAAPG